MKLSAYEEAHMGLPNARRRALTKAQATNYREGVLVIRDVLKAMSPTERVNALKEGLKMSVSIDEAAAIAQTLESALYMEARDNA